MSTFSLLFKCLYLINLRIRIFYLFLSNNFYTKYIPQKVDLLKCEGFDTMDESIFYNRQYFTLSSTKT